jgi:hypothetical protein
MQSRLTKRPIPIPDDVREQFVQIAASKDKPEEFSETHYFPAPVRDRGRCPVHSLQEAQRHFAVQEVIDGCARSGPTDN